MNAAPPAAPELTIVTGAGRGIGRAIAFEMAKRGSTVLCISRTNTCVQAAEEIRSSGGNADALPLNLADYNNARRAVAEWLNTRNYRRIGLVLAAASLGPCGPLWESRLDEWELMFRANVLGNLAVVQACLPRLLAQGFGRLLFFAGGGAAYAYPLFPSYAVSKTALVRAAENLHEDLKDAGDFAVTILAPGAVDTQMLATVRAHGGEVRTTVPVEEPVNFACSFLSASYCAFSGCFVHTRDNWEPFLHSGATLAHQDLWKLRRVE